MAEADRWCAAGRGDEYEVRRLVTIAAKADVHHVPTSFVLIRDTTRVSNEKRSL
jgi:hypothetical protein